jgi:hypothetical protein
MTIALADLAAQLDADVPALNGTPSAAQYAQAVTDAVADLGRRAPLTRVATLSIASGTASYALPADFVRLIRLTSLSSPSGGLMSGAGLVPVGRCATERHTIAGGQITFSPTPAYTLDRELWYAATYLLDEDDAYADLTDDRAQIAMLRARALALGLQAARAAADAWKHQAGPEAVDKTAQAPTLRAAAQDWQDQYEAAIKVLNGPQGRR